MLTKTDNIPCTICSMGKVDENRPIDLKEYTTPRCTQKCDTSKTLVIIPKRICLSKQIGKTVYDVSANFDIGSRETLLQQFKNLILTSNS